jgi:hypothetical protein
LAIQCKNCLRGDHLLREVERQRRAHGGADQTLERLKDFVANFFHRRKVWVRLTEKRKKISQHQGPMLCFFKKIAKNSAKKLAFFTQNKAKLCKFLIVTLDFEKNTNFLAKNCRKSQKIVIITSTTDWAIFFNILSSFPISEQPKLFILLFDKQSLYLCMQEFIYFDPPPKFPLRKIPGEIPRKFSSRQCRGKRNSP